MSNKATYRTPDGALLPPPKTRSFAAIRRTSTSAAKARARERPGPPREQCAIRALQYALAVLGRDVPHSHNLAPPMGRAPDGKPAVEWGVAPDGSKRVRSVCIRPTWERFVIPHWDFVAEDAVVVEKPPMNMPTSIAQTPRVERRGNIVAPIAAHVTLSAQMPRVYAMPTFADAAAPKTQRAMCELLRQHPARYVTETTPIRRHSQGFDYALMVYSTMEERRACFEVLAAKEG